MPTSKLAAWLTLSLLSSACTIDPKRPSLVDLGGEGGDEQAAGGSGHAGSGGSENEAGSEADDAGAGSVAGGEANGGSGGAPVPSGPSVCSQTAKWGNPSALAVLATAADEVLLSVTPDELDVAFLRDGVPFVAHRAKATNDFVVGNALDVPSGWSASSGAALSADGLRLVLISDPDRKKLGELKRQERGGAFSDVIDESAFEALNQAAIYAGKVYAAPVVSMRDTFLVLNSAFPGGTSTIVSSTRSGDGAWAAPTKLTPALFDGEPATRRLPTGISADERTLFYFDEALHAQRARWRVDTTPSSAWYDMLDLGGNLSGSNPNSACDRLYSATKGDVVVEED